MFSLLLSGWVRSFGRNPEFVTIGEGFSQRRPWNLLGIGVEKGSFVVEIIVFMLLFE